MAKFDKSCFRWYENGNVENIYSGRLCNVITGENTSIYFNEAIDEMRKIYDKAMLKKMTPEQLTAHCAEITKAYYLQSNFSSFPANEIEVTK